MPLAIDLIKRGADVNKRGPLPYTLLMIAAGRGYVQLTDLLLSAGADVYALDSTLGASALHKAAQSGVVDVVRLLLDHGAFINLQSATVGHTPLIDAVWAKKPGMVTFCLSGAPQSTSRRIMAAAFGTSSERSRAGLQEARRPKTRVGASPSGKC